MFVTKESDYFIADALRPQGIKLCIYITNCTIIGVTDHVSTICLSPLDIYLIYYSYSYSISLYNATLSTLNLYSYAFIGYLRGFILQSICEFDDMLELWAAVHEKAWSFSGC